MNRRLRRVHGRKTYKPNIVVWSEKEMIWLFAAMSLPAFEFLEACEDIAGMSGRTVSAIAAKARSLRGFPKPVCTKYQPAPKGTPATALEPCAEKVLAGEMRLDATNRWRMV